METGSAKQDNETVSKITDTLSKLTEHASLILNNLELHNTRNWRDASSIWEHWQNVIIEEITCI